MCTTCQTKHARSGISRRAVLGCSALTAFWASGHGGLSATNPGPIKPQNAVSPDSALEVLLKGNARYVEGLSRRHDFKHERDSLVSGQNPYAGILSCADSRVAPEYAFDSGRGDLFVCRVAGNFANADIVASFEYAVAILKTPLILVLGHDACGAVSATLKALQDNETLPGHLPSLVASLAGAARAGAAQAGDPLGNAIRQNVIDTVATLASATPILSEAVEHHRVRIVGGIYKLASGLVEIVG